MITRLLCLAAFGLLASHADAQQVAMAEYGTVPLTVSQPAGLESEVVVERGDVVWTESLTPMFAARALAEAPLRRRPGPLDGTQVGDLLLGVQLRSGLAYCPPIDYDAPTRRVQCYRDFDDDGTWDGAYYTRHDGPRTQVVPGMLRGLTAIQKTEYEIADPSEFQPVAAEWRFHRWRRGEAQFRLWIEDERIDELISCVTFEGAEPNQCVVADLLLEVVQEGRNSARITLLGQAPQRRFSIVTTGVSPLR